ncbi:N-acetylglutamate synthase, GNAT family [Paenibacillus sp. UNCCL117]|uniref:GNAT family N-acetyltransferase n=1 Tax=unclassified Paenibacillus TaxID=185978 RepID=UPI000884E232|nr:MULTISPECIES: GNAT family N-acetyltransferase [unclassified Paenibacillus]SDD40007.1 N-acetylglutamate synthase, GNAT family [Paenibacillus sp. cl123]SFW48224.1 N-acetylglutamate synthase, GNAT family [Paenibacillus sp. UNCCL117]
MDIRKLKPDERPPMELLLLADPSEELVEEYISRGRSYVMERDGEAIGVYVLLPTRPGTAELVNVAVAESFQGQGHGKTLVLHAIGQAKALGYKTIEVGTGSTGLSQLALYQKCGFRTTWIDRDFFTRHYKENIYENGLQVIDMVRMSLDL